MDVREAMRELNFVSVEAEFSGGDDEAQFDSIIGYPACGSGREICGGYYGDMNYLERVILDRLDNVRDEGGWNGDGPGIEGTIRLHVDGSAVLTGSIEEYVQQDSEYYHYDYAPDPPESED